MQQQMAHDLKLQIETKGGPTDVPLKADAAQGGLVLASSMPALPPGELTGVVKGKWGFDDWEGPKFHLMSAEAGKWTIAPGDESALVVGREDTLHIVGANTLCVDKIEAQPTGASAQELQWKSPKPNMRRSGRADERCSSGSGDHQHSPVRHGQAGQNYPHCVF